MSEQASSTAQADTWDSRIQNIANALGTDKEVVYHILIKLGYEPETGIEMLDDDEVTKFGDFREAFKSIIGKETDIPLIKLRLAFKFAKGSKKAEDRPGVDARTLQLRELGFKVRIEDASLAVLLPLYDPSLPNDQVSAALKKRFGDKPVIAFKEDGTVAIAETIGYASDLEQSLGEQDSIMVNGELTTLYPVGVKPDLVLEEDPLFPGVALRAGRSTVNHRNWQPISHANRQLVRIVVERGEVDVNDREAVLRILERSTETKRMQEAYPEAWQEFRNRKKLETLPTLKVTPTSAKPNNPFSHRKH